MPTDRGSSTHLRNGWTMARVGFWWGLFGLATHGVGVLVFGDAADWRGKLLAVPVWMAAFAAGGVLYSLFLPASVRHRSGPAAWERARTGALAGAATALPLAVLGCILSGAAAVAILVPVAAVIGATVALIAAHSVARPEDEGSIGGAGASPRLAGRP